MTNSCLQLVLRPLNKSLELVQSSLQNWVDDVAQSIIPSYSTQPEPVSAVHLLQNTLEKRAAGLQTGLSKT